MPLLRVAAFSISLDGFGAGPRQSLDHPMGEGGMALHRWALATRTFRRMHGGEGAAPPSTSSPAASTRRSSAPSTRPVARTCAWAAVWPQSASTSPPGGSTNSTSP